MRSTQDPVRVPTSFKNALRIEFRRAFHRPWDELWAVAINAALAAGGWFLLPPSLKNSLFSIHRPLAFAVVLASWMYSDVPATNVLGESARLSILLLDDQTQLRNDLLAKTAVLWTIVSPICILVSVGFGAKEHDALITALSVLWIVAVPFGALRLSSWMGILFPYHPISLKERWRRRRGRYWHMICRWILLVTLPYVLVPAIAVGVMLPTLIMWKLSQSSGFLPVGRPPHLFVGALMVYVLSIFWGWVGQRGALALCRRRRTFLLAYLGDPSRG